MVQIILRADVDDICMYKIIFCVISITSLQNWSHYYLSAVSSTPKTSYLKSGCTYLANVLDMPLPWLASFFKPSVRMYSTVYTS